MRCPSETLLQSRRRMSLLASVDRVSADFTCQSILSLLALIYFILASGPSPATRLLPWFIWGQLALDAIIYLFWLSAAATSGYSCIDLCNACDIADGYVDWGSLSCTCYTDLYYKRDYSPKPVNVLQPRRSRRTTSVGSIAAKQTFDALMTYAHTS